ncbi:MAG: hypothetical protein K2P84_00855 [Undibacterium sp.]|nr:hypothetical protein [Undibacterium sp.]
MSEVFWLLFLVGVFACFSHVCHFEHNFGHGKQNLSKLFATMILLAFLLHTTLDWVDTSYRAVREMLPSRGTFFEHTRALTQYILFEDWDHMMRFMYDGLTKPTTLTKTIIGTARQEAPVLCLKYLNVELRIAAF